MYRWNGKLTLQKSIIPTTGKIVYREIAEVTFNLFAEDIIELIKKIKSFATDDWELLAYKIEYVIEEKEK